MKFMAPRGFWQWLACFSPAILNWLGVFLGPRLQFAIFGNLHDESAQWAPASWGTWGFMLGAVLCLWLGGWLVRKSDSRRAIAIHAALYGLAFIVINAAIACGGCAIAIASGILS